MSDDTNPSTSPIQEGPPPPDTRRTAAMLAWLVVILLVVPAVWVAVKGARDEAAREKDVATGHEGGDGDGEIVSVGAADPATGLLRAPVGQMPEFGCVERSGAEMKTTDLYGNYVVADFIFTNCPGPCLKMTQAMAELQEATTGAADLRFVSFTVDPKRDSPEVLAKYADKHGADPERWLFLFMPKGFVHEVARKGFKLGHPDDPIFHSQKFVLLDREGRVRAYYEPLDDETWQERLLAALDQMRTQVIGE